MSYPFQKTDAGRSMSKRPKQGNDCTVRSVALVKRMAYDDAYDMLAAAGRKCFNGFDLGMWLMKQPGVVKLSFPGLKGQRRMNPVQFCQEYPEGRYICRVAKHVFAVIDGTVYDTFMSRSDRCIYLAWRIE